MKKFTTILTALVLLLLVGACSNDPIDQKLNEAADCILDDNHEKAQRICDNLVKYDYSQMSLEQKCDLAVLYACIFTELGTDDAGYKFVAVFDDTMESPQAARKYYKNTCGDDFYEGMSVTRDLVEMGLEIDSWNW